MSRVKLLGVLAGGLVLMGLATASQAAPPYRVFPAARPTPPAPYPTPANRPIGSDPRSWSPYPVNPYNPGGNRYAPIGSDPRSWSPYPLNPYNPGGNGYAPIGSDPRTWSPYPLNPYYPGWNVYSPIGSDPRTWSPYPLDSAGQDLDRVWYPD